MSTYKSNMKNNNINRYFKLYNEQTVNFTLENTSNILKKHILIGTTGALTSWWKIKSLLGFKILSLIIFPIVIITFIFSKFIGTEIDSKNKLNQFEFQSNDNFVAKNKNEDLLQEDVETIIDTSNKSHNRFININNNLVSLNEIKLTEQQINENVKIAISEIDYTDNSNLLYSESEFENSYLKHDPTNLIIDNYTETLFNSFIEQNGFFISPSINVSKINGNYEVLAGGKIGWTMNQKISVGLTGYGFAKNFIAGWDLINNNTNTINLNFGYGGVFFEFSNRSTNKLMRYTINSTFGFGGYSFENKSLIQDYGRPWGTFAFIEPEFSIDINLIKNVSIGINTSYRITKTFMNNRAINSNPVINNPDINGFNFGLFVKYGFLTN